MDEQPDPHTDQGPGLPVLIAIAASAGGLEATTQLVRSLPQNTGAAFVIAQHLSPSHKSVLTALIARETRLPVVTLDTPQIPQPNTIYITPPNWDVELHEGKLALQTPSPLAKTPKPLADRLFQSLAEECGENCVGIVLSGTGSDGTYGVRAIREAGGITIAQDLGSAKYDGMPLSAIQSGCIDLTMPPDMIGEHILGILSQPRDLGELQIEFESGNRFSDLFQILMQRTGVDMREYKKTTVNRRIARRMTALNIEDYDAYVTYCGSHEEEVDALYKDLMISVTRFFRDPAQFERLRKSLELLAQRSADRQLRLWIAGCATGEEAYSIVILLAEVLGGLDRLSKHRVQIFATDIDTDALSVARRGLYPLTAIKDIPREYVDKYFHVSDDRLEVDKQLRSVVLFSRHDVTQDPPFINMDLISMRNLLIYFSPPLQEKVLSRIANALVPNGKLFLGTSESVGSLQGHFETRSLNDKVFSKRGLRHNDRAQTHGFSSSAPSRLPPASDASPQSTIAAGMFETLTRTVAPNGFISTRGNDIIRIIGDISNITDLHEGNSQKRLNTKVLAGDLPSEAASLVTLALRSKASRAGRWHRLGSHPQEETRLTAYPLLAAGDGEDHVLFAIQTRPLEAQETASEGLSGEERLRYVRQIEEEIASTREALQQTIEELQTSNEELQSVNEEMQATNEELQATNEELETSNEELQATNEELVTVNEEMHLNATELQIMSDELSAILEATPYPTLVVDPALQIRHASAEAKQFFGIARLPKSGLHLSQCSLPLGLPPLGRQVSEAIRLRHSLTLSFHQEGHQKTVTFTPFLKGHLSEIAGATITII